MKNKSLGEKIFNIIVYTIMGILTICTMIPFMQVITVSVSPLSVTTTYGLHLIPTIIDWSGYREVLKHTQLWYAYRNTIIVVIVHVLISDVLLLMGGYPLSRKYMPHRKFWTFLVLFTMYFSGGIVPVYMLVRLLGLRNTIWALVLPGAFGAYNLIIVRNFFESLPEEIMEAAKIDGASEANIVVRIILPLSKAIMATVSLWITVSVWNNWQSCMFYIDRWDKMTLQYVLRRILDVGLMTDAAALEDNVKVSTESMKMASIIVTILPIMILYPFLQKYFVKGVMMGSVKG